MYSFLNARQCAHSTRLNVFCFERNQVSVLLVNIQKQVAKVYEVMLFDMKK